MIDKLKWSIVNITKWIFVQSAKLVGLRATIIVDKPKYSRGKYDR